MSEEDEAWQELAEAKGRRSRRRVNDATHDPIRLRQWFFRHYGDWDSWSHIYPWRWVWRATRHSCHLAGCEIRRHEHEWLNRRERHQTKIKLKKGVDDE